MNPKLLLCLALVLSGALSGTAQPRFEYSTTNGQVTITANFPNGNSVIIPDTINGQPVTGIGSYAFGNYCELTHVAIPSSVTNIECFAFNGCSSLTNIVIPRTVTGIGFNRYYGNTTNDSFGSCKNLTAIIVDPNNPAYSSLDGVLFNKDRTELLQVPAGRTGSYTVPKGVTRIGYRAFDCCDKLTSVKIPKTVASIGEEAFFHCSQLGNVNIPNSVTAVGTCIFLEDPRLEHFVFPKTVTHLASQVPPPPPPLD